METLILETERYGWTTFRVMVRKQILSSVHTTLGAVMTVVTMRMSPSDARSQVCCVTCHYLLLIIVYVSGKVKSENKPQHAEPLMVLIATAKNLNMILYPFYRASVCNAHVGRDS